MRILLRRVLNRSALVTLLFSGGNYSYVLLYFVEVALRSADHLPCYGQTKGRTCPSQYGKGEAGHVLNSFYDGFLSAKGRLCFGQRNRADE